MWSEGRSEWQPLSAIPDLMTSISQLVTDSSNMGEFAVSLYLSMNMCLYVYIYIYMYVCFIHMHLLETVKLVVLVFSSMSLTVCFMQCAVPSNDDEFEKWQKEIGEAEGEAEGGSLSGTSAGALAEDVNDRPSTPPEGEEEFTDDDGTTYKWDRSIRAWVPQVGSCTE